MSQQREDKIKEIIKKSGNNLEEKTEKILKDLGWDYLSSSYYLDKATNKKREADIIAFKDFPIFRNDNPKNTGKEYKILIKLFISCKFINEPIVFRFEEKNIEEARKIVIKDQLSLNEEWDEDYVLGNILDKHHYISEKSIAKRYDKNNQKDEIFDAWDQAINSCLYSPSNENDYKYREVYKFPVVVIDSFENIFKKEGEDGYIKLEDNFQFEISSLSIPVKDNSIGKYFLVDFVSVDKLGDFIGKNFRKIDGVENVCENKGNDLSIFQTLLSHRENKRRFDQQQNTNSNNDEDDFDPYYK